ncbi:MAG: hypothetical protein GX184_09565 [Clostridiaceae bacterium]|nr:hypothetical protein [Clostridiaceae bacterium]
MPGEKKFGSSPFGFNKSDVNAYIEKMIREFDQRLKEKDDEISNLKMQIREMKTHFDSVSQESSQLMKEKELIATALIQAQEKADAVLREAKQQAQEEKIRLDQELEKEREQIIDIKRDIKDIKDYITRMLEKFRAELEQSESYIENRENKYTPNESVDDTEAAS